MSAVTRPGLFRSLFSNLNLSSILSGTSRTLNVVNQTIPLVRQAGPIMKNAKTMFRVMSEFKKVDTPSKKSNSIENPQMENAIQKKSPTNSGPTFFL